LDSSTSLDFAKALRVATNLTANVSISALYQPGDSLAGVYDKVLLLHEGFQIFFGRLDEAKAHFENMGFECGARQTTAEFLVSITDSNVARVRAGYENRVPRSPEDFENRWRTSDQYHRLQADLAAHGANLGVGGSEHIGRFKAARSAEKAPATRTNSPFSLNLALQFRTTFIRACQRIKGEYAYFVAITITMLVIPLMIGSMFYQIDPGTSGFFSKGGCIFFITLFNIIITFAEVVAQFSQRPIVEKQHSYGMYHPYIDALANMMSQYPLKIFNIMIFTVIVYFMANLKREAGAFFLFVLFVYLSTLTMTAWFRLVAALANTVEAALAVAGLSVLPLAIYGGYVIPRPSMHPWFEWISYINPIYYTVEALMAIEFHGRKAPCQTLVPSGPGYENTSTENQVCPVVGSKPGIPFVSGDDYLSLSLDYHFSHVWRNLGISICFFVAFTVAYAAATEFKKLDGPTSAYLLFRRSAVKAKEPQSSVSDAESGTQYDPSTPGDSDERTEAIDDFLNKSRDILCWQHINYDVDVKGGKRRLLHDVQGFVEPGTLTALMGASGAGKTTVLNVLAERVDTGVVSGNMTINGATIDASFKRRIGYVQQQDVHIAEMTVREAFRFSAILRQPRETSIAEKYAYVEKIISLLGMTEYAEAVIGMPGRGLSVEKRKRTTIGLELVARPSLLLFLDEPTSGLDSQSALSIIKLIRSLADAGQAILCTIHQPSATLLQEFDRLMLLGSGGRTVYFGDLGSDCQKLLDYFERNGAPKCPARANPAEYVLDQVGAGVTGHATLNWSAIWEASPEQRAVATRIVELESTEKTGSASSRDISLQRTFAMPWFQQYLIVQKRIFTQHWRSPSYINGKLFINVVGGLFLAFTFYKESNSIQGLQNRTFSVFLILLLCLVLIVLLQPRLIFQRAIYTVRERYSNMYHWTVFVVANVVVEVPFNVVISSLGFICWYFPVGWWSDISEGRGAFMYLVFILYQLYHTSFSQAIAIVCPNAETAAMLTILFYTFILAFSGVLVPLTQLPQFWHFAYYVSPFTWLVSALMTTGTHDVQVECSELELNVFQPPTNMTCGDYAGAFTQAIGANILNPKASQDCKFCMYAVADTYLKTIGMDYGDRWRNVGFLVVYILFNVTVFGVGFWVFNGGFKRFKR
jgi:ATP-binding cassette subfamily G (WHITE) protein 2 (SNQ2)